MSVKESNYTSAISLPVFEYISSAASALKLDAFVIGGYVRDFIMDRAKSKDIDIVAVGSGIDLANAVAQLLPGKPKVQIFKNYGTAMLKFGQLEIEFVGARRNLTKKTAGTRWWIKEVYRMTRTGGISP